MSSKPYTFDLVQGVDTYSPDITSTTLKIKRLQNVQPRKLRLNAARGFTEFQALGSEVFEALAHYRKVTLNRDYIYAITDTSIYLYDFATEQFLVTPLYTGLTAYRAPYAAVTWDDCVYLTHEGIDYILKLQDSTVTQLSVTLGNLIGGRYAQVSNYHLMLASVNKGATQYPLLLKWSDLYLPEDFTISSASEAGEYTLEPGNVEITGLSYQRGRDVIYTKSSIWLSRYAPLPTGYTFEPFLMGLGNVLHGGQIRVREIDFFIGDDNVYAIDGFQLQAIGDPIWEFFRESVQFNDQISIGEENFRIRAFHKVDFNEVWWLYRRTDASYWIIVYNYKENKWSDRDPQGIRSHFQQEYGLRYDNYQQNHEFFGANGQILEMGSASYQKESTDPIDLELETAEFDFDELFEYKEVDSFTLFYSGAGTPALNVQIGTRKHRFDSVVWSAVSPLSDQLTGETTFHFRNKGRGRLIRFKITCANTDTDYISEFTKLSFRKLEDEINVPAD